MPISVFILLFHKPKKFLLKWGFTPRFFRKHYLKGDDRIKYDGALSDVKVSLNVLIDLLINKLKFLYYKVFYK